MVFIRVIMNGAHVEVRVTLLVKGPCFNSDDELASKFELEVSSSLLFELVVFVYFNIEYLLFNHYLY